MTTVPLETSPPPELPRPRLGRPVLLLLLLAVVLFVLMPFFFWRATWFGRPLSEQETADYLADREHPRRAQHALVQISERLRQGDASVKRWYPEVKRLAGHERPEIRATAAWVMGQDNQSAEFHAALTGLLADADPLVRRNAALSLVRFGDPAGRGELRAMLHSFDVIAPQTGVLVIRLRKENSVNPGTLLARLQTDAAEPLELRSTLPGAVERWLVDDGARVKAGDRVARISPAEDQVWEALRALYLVGRKDDLPDIQPYLLGREGFSPRIEQQAQLTEDAIRRRSEDN